MIIVELTVDSPVLSESLRRVSGLEIEWEQTYTRPDGRTQMLFWVVADDFEEVESALDDDPSVINPTALTDTGDRRLYRVDFTALGDETNLLPQLTEVGGVLQEAVGTREGWRCQIRFPDREGFESIYRFCLDNGVGVTLHRLYEQTDPSADSGYSLTAAQRQTLLEAVDCGYLEIPRRCTQQEFAERLGISDTATSQRFRRGVKRLILETIYPGDPPTP